MTHPSPRYGRKAAGMLFVDVPRVYIAQTSDWTAFLEGHVVPHIQDSVAMTKHAARDEHSSGGGVKRSVEHATAQ